ncbi:rop guanine nucleotide exchange factor 14 isoform X2 [Coffea eugenioides]|uniref:rop guanine nucleotide exchange factor 14 isoform X2 n=1 Tax=Coffea eugenioides TaxID=49369 RepID=UPI000F6124C1|nr:rop guanine nucleotide exchange factor 14 isoform X2 [Coffea eugenioides]
MLIMKRKLACWSRGREACSMDFDEERIITYNGLERCILNSQSYNNATRQDGCATDSGDEDASSCCSNHVATGPFSSHCTMMRMDDCGPDESEFSGSPQHFYQREEPGYITNSTDLETMKEKFAKLLLGEDVTGGNKGVSSALALSNSITNLAVSVFGELWKLEPLPEERKRKWRKEMNWLLSPTNYMVELVPAKKSGTNGQIMEIMTAKARSDIHMNLPALEKLDSMLIEILDSMVDTEFWYVEVGSRAEGRSRSAGESKRWWLPSPRVPAIGLSDAERKKLLNQAKRVHQVLKAAKSTNESVLLEMPVPDIVKDALNKSGKASLGEELYKVLAAEMIPAGVMINSLNLESDHSALQAINKLEAAMFAWKEIIKGQSSEESPARRSWSFGKDPVSEMDKVEFLLNRAEHLRQQLKARYPNLPQTFLDAIKVEYGTDVGHSILEAYSRVLGNLAFSVLSRIGDILEEDHLSNPSSPVAASYFPGIRIPGISDSPLQCRIRHSLLDQMNRVDGNAHRCSGSEASYSESPFGDSSISSMTVTPSRSRVWCVGGDSCGTLSATSSP